MGRVSMPKGALTRAVAVLGGVAVASACALCALAFPAAASAAGYVVKNPPLTTPWTASARRGIPLAQYPRPQLERSQWLNLNGRWEYGSGSPGEAPPLHRSLPETILVPFPVQSPLSGIERGDQAGWYRRVFAVPAAWRGQRVMLNFGAVSWLAKVYVNGHFAGAHKGDYTSFSLDITRFLHRRASNELVVGFTDPVGTDGEPVGKQVAGKPSGIWHTASSGIWQTVWLEPVAPRHLAALDLTPQLQIEQPRSDTLLIDASVTGGGAGNLRLSATAYAGGRTVARASGAPGHLVVHIPNPSLWWPSHPFLYGLRLRLMAGHTVLDEVSSYFAMRSISVGEAGGAPRLLLNGRFIFETGALDQGMWPDGLYTPPSDAAMRSDVAAAKALGYDMLREHVKVQPDRWYMWADRLGLLVWQDMPNLLVAGHRAITPAGEAEFRRELAAVVRQLRSHPSIVMWIPFNEGWGQFDVAGITAEVKALDPTRPIDPDSGSADCCNAQQTPDSSIDDVHLYTGPYATPAQGRASVIGEYGGDLPYPPPHHRWPGTPESVGSPVAYAQEGQVLGELSQQYAELAQEMRTSGLSGAVFTEFAGDEQEIGILTYDRRVFTIPPQALRPLNAGLISLSQQPADLLPQPAAVPAGTSGLWTFDAGSGKTAADSSGNNNPITLSGGAGWAKGVHGSALAITAAGQTASTARPVINPDGSFTVSAWLHAASPLEDAAAISESDGHGSSFSLGLTTAELGQQSLGGEAGVDPSSFRGLGTWWTFMVPNSPYCPVIQCGATRANLRYADARLNSFASGWHQVTGVYSVATATIAIYVDGMPEDVEHLGLVPPVEGPLVLGTGNGDYPGADAFLGDIDTLRTYARALTPGEVWQLYLASR